MRLINGARVITPDGKGKIVNIEFHVSLRRYGVLHDKFPKGREKNFYKDDVLYYVKKDLKLQETIEQKALKRARRAIGWSE